jgi:hypothetical protein
MSMLARLTMETSVVYLSVAFVLLGMGLSLVMTGATAAIIGAAPMRFAGVASAVQQAAMQLGGSLGTAVLGAVMSATIVATLPGRFTDAGLAAPGADDLRTVQSTVAQGGAVVPEGAAPDVVAAVTEASNLAFLSGLQWAFGIAAALLALAAVMSMFMRGGMTGAGSEDDEESAGAPVPAVHV